MAVVVAQLTERSLLTPEVRGSKFSHRRNFIMNMFTVSCQKNENKEKEAENGLFNFFAYSGSSSFFSKLKPVRCPARLLRKRHVGPV